MESVPPAGGCAVAALSQTFAVLTVSLTYLWGKCTGRPNPGIVCEGKSIAAGREAGARLSLALSPTLVVGEAIVGG